MALVYLTSICWSSWIPPNGDNVANSRLHWAREEACHPAALDPIVATYDIRSRQELVGTGYRA
jgi:hypothetical protein